jgi:hypothetical protein
VPNVNVTYEEMQAAARRQQVPVIRLRATTAVAAAVVVALPCVQSRTHAATAPARVRPMSVTTGASAWYVASAPVIAAAPGCGKGANVRKVVATYKARKYNTGGESDDSSARFH